MTIVNKNNYLARRTTGGRKAGNPKGRPAENEEWRDWYSVNGYRVIGLGNVTFPKEMVGKRVRFKVEYIEPPKKE